MENYTYPKSKEYPAERLDRICLKKTCKCLKIKSLERIGMEPLAKYKNNK